MSTLKSGQGPSQRKKPAAAPARLANPNKEYGEGNYKASREYNDATHRFVQSGKVDAAARAARPASKEQARELQQAEDLGRSRRKDEDPALLRGRKRTGA